MSECKDECADHVQELLKQIEQLQAENQAFGNVLAVIHCDGGHYITKHGHDKASQDAIRIVLDLRAENERLKEFARVVIEQECWSLIPLDGGDLQELAEKLGLIVSCTATEEDVDDECDFEVGDTIFKFSDTLKGHNK